MDALGHLTHMVGSFWGGEDTHATTRTRGADPDSDSRSVSSQGYSSSDSRSYLSSTESSSFFGTSGSGTGSGSSIGSSDSSSSDSDDDDNDANNNDKINGSRSSSRHRKAGSNGEEAAIKGNIPALPNGVKAASKNRDKEFHKLFANVPSDELLLTEYSCALARDILRQGRLFITVNHLCFYSNIFGYVLNIVIPVNAITRMEKIRTAGIFPNAISVYVKKGQSIVKIPSSGQKSPNRSRSNSRTSPSQLTTIASVGDDANGTEDRFSLHSFVNRETVITLVENLRQIGTSSGSGHNLIGSARSLNASTDQLLRSPDGSLSATPRNLKPSGHRQRRPRLYATNTSSSAASNFPSSNSSSINSGEDSESEGDSGSIGNSSRITGSRTNTWSSPSTTIESADEISNPGQDMSDAHVAAQEAFRGNGSAPDHGHSDAVGTRGRGQSDSSRSKSGNDDTKTGSDEIGDGDDISGPLHHGPTKMPAANTDEKILATETVDAPLGQVANLLFGPNIGWYRHFLLDVEKNFDLEGLSKFEDKTRKYEYTKPLHGAVGPKQTRCKCKEKIENWDLNTYVSVITETATPDVPSGNAFTTMTRIVLAWGENNNTVIRLGTWIDWTGKTWLKGPIEKGAMDGQSSYAKDLVAELESKLEASSAKSGVTPGSHSGSKEKKKKKKRRSADEKERHHKDATSTSKVASPSMFGDITALWQVIVLVVIVLSILYWIYRRIRGYNSTGVSGKDLDFVEQELRLWQWIDDRSQANVQKQQLLSDPEIAEAVRITERRLQKLREVLAIQA